MEDPRRSVRPEKIEDLKLNKETLQDLSESESEGVKGGQICPTRGGSCCKGEDSMVTK